MGGPSRIDQTPVRLNTRVTEERQTPKTDFGSRVKDGLQVTAGVIAQGAAVASSGIPGGAILSSAITGGMSSLNNGLSSGQRGGGIGGGGVHGAYGGGSTSSVPTSGSGSSTSVIPGDSYSQGMDLLQAQAASNMQFLTLQSQMQQENQKFSTLSNVMKVRHDTAKNSIQNIH